ncbi:MAG TPA: thioesterase family protein [Gemmatimonadaceae bacterium]|nr:thioesterase family protein [Gemmatimonadaceae bacterium]
MTANRTHVPLRQATTLELRVRYAETDQMGVVYHSHYLIWCEMGRTDHIRTLGTSYREMEAAGIRLAVMEASIRFHAPARYDDRIRVTTTLTDVSSRTVTFDYVIDNADTGERLATARTVLISLGADGRVTALPAGARQLLSRGSPGA